MSYAGGKAVPHANRYQTGSSRNPVTLGNEGEVRVGVLSGTYQGISVDATTIDRSSLSFAGASPVDIGESPKDLNRDGKPDMVFYFATQSLNLTQTSMKACLTSKTRSNIYFEGCDSVRIVPP